MIYFTIWEEGLSFFPYLYNKFTEKERVKMKGEKFFAMKELKLKKEVVKEIVEMLLNYKAQEKIFSFDELPDTFYVVYSDCNNMDVMDEFTGDAYYNKYFPRVLVIGSYGKDKELKQLCIAHELIHELQHHLYLFFDSDDLEFPCPYHERWEEKCAKQFEEKVRDMIRDNIISYDLVYDNHDDIDRFLMRHTTREKPVMPK